MLISKIDIPAIILQFTPMVHSMAHKYCSKPENYEDYFQTGVLSICQAMQTFDKKKGCESTWIYFIMRKNMQKQRASEHPVTISADACKNPKNKIEKIDIDILNDDNNLDTSHNPLELIINQENNTELLLYLQRLSHKCLNTNQCKVIVNYFIKGKGNSIKVWRIVDKLKYYLRQNKAYNNIDV
jgi:RNA polymerase sigma factor (sigma-70 family)